MLKDCELSASEYSGTIKIIVKKRRPDHDGPIFNGIRMEEYQIQDLNNLPPP